MTFQARETECWGQRWAVGARSWAQASDPVSVRMGGGEWTPAPGGKQVADYRHRPESAMRDWLLAGEDKDDPEILAAVDAAVARMHEVEDEDV